MKVVKTINECRAARRELGKGKLALVPTMGALHEGHATLVRAATAVDLGASDGAGSVGRPHPHSGMIGSGALVIGDRA